MTDTLHWILLAAALLLGAATGSFLNVCVYRLPREGLSLGRPRRSFCPSCGMQIAWYDNVPVLSWVLLGGRCRGCRAPISLRYLLVEGLTAALFVAVTHTAFAQGLGWGATLSLLVLVSGLVVAAFVDIDLRLVPDEVTVGGMLVLPFAVLLFPEIQTRHVDSLLAEVLARASSWLAPGLAVRLGLDPAVWGWTGAAAGAAAVGAGGVVGYRAYRRRFLPAEPCGPRELSLAAVLAGFAGGLSGLLAVRPEVALAPRVFALWVTLVGMLAGSSLVYLVGVAGRLAFRRPAMGLGDVKLMGLLGGVAGWWGALVGFFLACFLGALYGTGRFLLRGDRYLPFVPFLAMGSLAAILWPEAFQAAIEWYLARF